jgi:hypothetical protein
VGLDIYAGPVSRYAGAGWQTIVQQAGAAAGMPVVTVRPGESMEDVMRRALAEGGDAPIREIRMTDIRPRTQPIAEWKAGVMRSLGLNEEWDDRPDGEYYTDKPGWEGYGAVILLAAYDEQPALAPGAKVKRLIGTRTVAAVAPGDFGEAEAFKAASASPARYPTLLRGAEWCLPIVGGPVLFAAPTPRGRQVTMGHVDRLLDELKVLNQRTLKLSPAEMEAARQAGPTDPGSLEGMAAFGLSVVMPTAEFAAAHRVAWIMDY